MLVATTILKSDTPPCRDDCFFFHIFRGVTSTADPVPVLTIPITFANDGSTSALTHPQGYNLVMAGSHQHVIVRSCREQELASHMLPPAFVDHSRSLRCPMPGQVRGESAGFFAQFFFVFETVARSR